MRNIGFCRTVLYPCAAALLLACSSVAQEQDSRPPLGPGNVFVHPALGGSIFGFDIDQNGGEGLLSEAATRGFDCRYATETFDLKTGDIVKVLGHGEPPYCGDDDVTLGVVDHSIGLVEHQHTVGFGRLQSTFQVVNPLEANAFTGSWAAPGRDANEVWGMSRNQGTPVNAFQVFDLRDSLLYVFGSKVATSSSGPVPQLTSTPGVIGLDTKTNTAYLSEGPSGRGNELDPPSIQKVDLTTGRITTFGGVGSGTVQGLAVDSADNIACTTTYEDSSVEFYDLAAQTGFGEVLPGCASPACSGFDVEFDPVNKLFLVAQPVSSQVPNLSTIYVYDAWGTLMETLNGFNFYTQRFDILPVHIAIHPSDRSGFVDFTDPFGTSALQSFTY
jgi:hypothetical protein